jgi:serine/threonine-protein kinase
MLWSKGHELQSGKYIIEKELGQGYFGFTYKARDTYSNKFVAIKIPNYRTNAYSQRDKEFNEELDKVFKKEVESLGSLLNDENSHIVKFIQTFNDESDVPCIVMEFVEGERLDELVKRKGALREQDAIKYIKQVGKGLIFLHSKNLIHRDVHPGNILINEEKAILIDFGLARNSQSLYSYVSTFAHQVYAPPEQRRGTRKASVDIYSLSASLYYAITAQEPPSAYDRQTSESQGKSELENSLKENKISNVREAILKGMELTPEKRPQSIEEWLKILSSPTKKGVDYTRLENFLKTGQWKEADIETYNVMLEATGRKEKGSLSIESIENFPCKDLCTIDQLWVKYSNERFGFSVQKRIWNEVHQNIFNFGDYVGWRKGLLFREKWKKHSQLKFKEEAREGHLPAIMLRKSDPKDETLSKFMTALFSRVKACKR